MKIDIERPTLMQRATVSQEFREILSEDRHPNAFVRRVQVMVPQQPATYMIMTPDPRFIDEKTGEPILDVGAAAGLNRMYKGTLLTPGAQISFHLLPGQALWAGCEVEYSELGIICEYIGGNL